jgi:hypothetical protein
MPLDMNSLLIPERTLTKSDHNRKIDVKPSREAKLVFILNRSTVTATETTIANPTAQENERTTGPIPPVYPLQPVIPHSVRQLVDLASSHWGINE